MGAVGQAGGVSVNARNSIKAWANRKRLKKREQEGIKHRGGARERERERKRQRHREKEKEREETAGMRAQRERERERSVMD